VRQPLLTVVTGLAILSAACSGAAEQPTVLVTTTAQATTVTPLTMTTEALTMTTEAPVGGGDLIDEGKSIAARNGCAACHSADGAALVGPTWQGLYGKDQLLDDGTSVVVGDDYLLRAIVDPSVEVVDGFPAGVMPETFRESLTDRDIEALIEYIKSL
jgi:cytochrome c oxidase subunit 2